MIRENKLNCKLYEIKKSARQMYEEEKGRQEAPGACPVCGSRGKWTGHGQYERDLIDYEGGKTVYSRIKVRRVRCGSCGHTHAILPDYIIPYSTYSLLFILRVLEEYLQGYSRVEKLCRRFSITPSMLYKWKRLFKEHKDIWLGIVRTAETSLESFLRELIKSPDYAKLFGIPFFKTAARSFLQGHRDAARFRHAVFRKGNDLGSPHESGIPIEGG